MTAAGYTKNFGGLLADQMWAEIFNHKEVQGEPALKELLFNNFDYESVYHEVCNDDTDSEKQTYTVDQKEAIRTAILKVYKNLDVIAQNYIPATDPSKSAILHGAKNIINYLTRDKSQINFIFTLNQDLFIERLMSFTDKPIVSPGIGRRIVSPGLMNSRHPLKIDDFIKIPARDELDTTKDATTLSNLECHYIKLHGSFGWKSPDPDRSNMLVIGRNKENQIANEPLLIWYLDLFKQVLFQGRIKLLIIGYGFRDKHINEIIADAIEKNNMKLYIISPTKPEEFKNDLIKADNVYGKQILKGLSGYFQASLEGLFPPDGSETHTWKDLYKCFFD